jgi:hypothetical protein
MSDIPQSDFDGLDVTNARRHIPGLISNMRKIATGIGPILGDNLGQLAIRVCDMADALSAKTDTELIDEWKAICLITAQEYGLDGLSQLHHIVDDYSNSMRESVNDELTRRHERN